MFVSVESVKWVGIQAGNNFREPNYGGSTCLHDVFPNAFGNGFEMGLKRSALPCTGHCLSLKTVTVMTDMKSVVMRTTNWPGFAWNAQPCVATDMILILTIFPNNS